MINNPGPQILIPCYPVASPTALTDLPATAVVPATGPTGTAYVVATGGSDITGRIGNMFLPFATIAGAYARAIVDGLTGVDVLCSPGAFTGPNVVPLGLTGTLTVRGAGPRVTSISIVGNLFDFAGGARGLFTLSGASVSASSSLIKTDGTGLGGTNFAGGITLDNCEILGGSMALSFVAGNFQVRGCTSTAGSGTWTLTTCKTKIISDSILLSFAFVIHDDNDDGNKPAGTIAPLFLAGSEVGAVTLEAQGSILGENATLGALSANVLTVNAGVTIGPGIQLNGSTIASVGLTGAAAKRLPDTALALTLSFEGSSVLGAFGVACIVGAVNDQTLLATNTYFGGTAPVIGEHVNMVARGASSLVPVNTWSTPTATGTILPPTFALVATALAGVAQVVTLPFRLPGATYAIAPDCDDATAVYLAVTARSATQFTVTVVIAAGNFRGTLSYNA